MTGPRIQNGAAVTYTYTMYASRPPSTERELVEYTTETEPFTYLHGGDEIHAALEDALAGHHAGDDVHVDLTPAQRGAEYDPDLVEDLPLALFPKPLPVEKDRDYLVVYPDGVESVFIVRSVDRQAGTVRVDHNDRLSGATLHWDIHILEVEAGDGRSA